jgi:predicted DNA-binding transcriptional regulator AlpA
MEDRLGTAPVPRLALRAEEAARALGLSDESFTRYVKPHVKRVVLSQPDAKRALRLYPVSELQAWLDQHAEAALREVA